VLIIEPVALTPRVGTTRHRDRSQADLVVLVTWPQRDLNPCYRLERAGQRFFVVARRCSRVCVSPASEHFLGQSALSTFPSFFIGAGNRRATGMRDQADSWTPRSLSAVCPGWVRRLVPWAGTERRGAIQHSRSQRPTSSLRGTRWGSAGPMGSAISGAIGLATLPVALWAAAVRVRRSSFA
jgi:hypothetical protein